MKLLISLLTVAGLNGGVASAEMDLSFAPRSLILSCNFGDTGSSRAEVYKISAESGDSYQLKLCVAGVCGSENVTPKKLPPAIAFGTRLTILAETTARDFRCQHRQTYWYVQGAKNSPCGCAADGAALDEI